MNAEEVAKALVDLKHQSDAVGMMVKLINQYEKYLREPKNSPMEDQEERALEVLIEEAAATQSRASEVIMAFIDALVTVARTGAPLQDYLHHIGEFLQERVNELQNPEEKESE